MPPPGASVLWARARRVIESSRMTTSFFISTIRLAFSSTISVTWMCSSGGSSNVLATTSAFGPLHQPLHFGHFLRPLVDQQHDDVATPGGS